MRVEKKTGTGKPTIWKEWWPRKHWPAARYATRTNKRIFLLAARYATRTSKWTFLLEQEARPKTFINELNNAFDKTVYWRKNFPPTGAAGKCFINDMMQINPWVYNTPIKSIALKALHVMPTWLMQKPSKNSK